ncbi:hypothetical protein CDV36_014326 [Fusarium kuroshium]|uniref:Heterokaryon incompatibility domain-containing protein n=1 Tax=Fusarium kuroshium TaxID=2010991 RepID=A0A3M2RI68_9HYPO|nr:hypothetical protein CDV36_014326 [Fusarium kuroshium]
MAPDFDFPVTKSLYDMINVFPNKVDVFGSSARLSEPLRTIMNDPSLDQQFIKTLSIDQLSSYRLLQEWFKAQDQDPASAKNAKTALKDVSTANLGTTSYHASLARLYTREMSTTKKFSVRPGKRQRLADLRELRQKAATIAACQRIAISICSTTSLASSNEMSVTIKPPYGASIDPGFWIEKAESDGLPYYLWDTHDRKVAILADLMAITQEAPEYVAISHTWGNSISAVRGWCHVPNVPWKIPYLDKLDVMELPEMLAHLSEEWRYVWIDLLAIPQGCNSDVLATRQRTEIKKQPDIFRNAKTAIAWFSDIQNWTLAPSVLQYLGLKFMMATSGDVINSAQAIEREALARSQLDETVELMAWSWPDLADRKEKPGTPNDWFTSTWTLQETCIRPDMLLATAKFEFLKVTDNMMVCINDIAALCLVSKELIKGDQPRAVQDVLQTFENSGLVDLLDLQPLRVIPEDKKLGRPARLFQDSIANIRKFSGQTLGENAKAKPYRLSPSSQPSAIRSNLYEIGTFALLSPIIISVLAVEVCYTTVKRRFN